MCVSVCVCVYVCVCVRVPVCVCVYAIRFISPNKILRCITTVIIIIIIFMSQELRESRGGSPELPVPNSPYVLCGFRATLEDYYY